MITEPTDCWPDRARCCVHYTSCMMQIFSLKLARTSTNMDSIQLYGYIAVRDCQDQLLNYVINHSRDDPIIMRQVHIFTCTNCLK